MKQPAADQQQVVRAQPRAFCCSRWYTPMRYARLPFAFNAAHASSSLQPTQVYRNGRKVKFWLIHLINLIDKI
jgi:hypothetical protein